MAWTCDKFKPKVMIDIATLTGAVSIALGVDRCGLMSNNQEFANEMMKHFENGQEPFSQLPLDDWNRNNVINDVSDI